MLCAVGDLVEDVVVHLDGPPLRGTDTVARIERRRGGSAANVAAFAASLGAAHSGARTAPMVRFIGRIGDDPLGQVLADDLVHSGVDVRVQRHGRTGAIVVLVGPGGERDMLTDRAAAFGLSDVDPGWLDGVSWLHVPGYSLIAEPIGASCRAMVEAVRALGGRVSVDVSSVASVERFGRRRFCDELAAIASDVTFATEDEARLLDDPPTSLLVVKRGPEPVILRWPDGRGDEVPVDPVEQVVDTTGAGDAFAAGFVTATMAGADPLDASRAGSALAARTLGVAGAALAPP